MKVTIHLEVPLDKAFVIAKGDRSFREIVEAAGAGTHNNLIQVMNGRAGTTLKTVRRWGKVLKVDVDAAIKQALKEQGL